MELARHITQWGTGRSRNVACVIVGPNHEIRSTGVAGFPRGVDESKDERHERPAKYGWGEHAERNAVFNAARVGIPLEGCTIYVPWYPCMDCARAIVQTGITRLVATEPNWDDPIWGGGFRMAREMFDEIGFRVDFMDGPKMGDPK